MSTKLSTHADKLLQHSRKAMQAYDKAARFIRQKELRKLLDQQRAERKAFCEQLESCLESANESPMLPDWKDVSDIHQAVQQEDPFELIRACIREECAELEECKKLGGLKNARLKKVIASHTQSLAKALSRLHSIEAMANYRIYEPRLNWPEINSSRD